MIYAEGSIPAPSSDPGPSSPSGDPSPADPTAGLTLSSPLGDPIPPGSSDPDLVTSWSKPNDEVPPEELDTPEAATFAGIDAYAYDDEEKAAAIKECRELILKHVSPELVAAVPEVLEYFLSEKVVNVFLAIIKGWEGIKGNEDIELQFSVDMPNEMREKARPIPEHMLKVVEKELNRLLGYFLEKSTSPCASPLVCAPKATAPWILCVGTTAASTATL